MHGDESPLREEEQVPIPSVWRPVIEAMVACMAAGDWQLDNAPRNVARVDQKDARLLAAAVDAYGAGPLVPLPAATWETSISMWQPINERWDLLVDLWTAEGAIDLVLFVEVYPTDDIYEFRVYSMYVP